MLIDMPGIHKVTVKLAGGVRRTYYYAWRGGPAIEAEPGTNEFVEEYMRHCRERRQVAQGTIKWLIKDFQDSSEWRAMKERTRDDHLKMFKLIDAKFGTVTLRKAEAKGSRKLFKFWRDEIGKTSARNADKAVNSLSRLFTYALDQEEMTRNPIAAIGKLYRNSRADKWWREHETAAFRAVAPEHIRFAMLLAIDTGQRQGDLLSLQWNDYDGQRITLIQSKSGQRKKQVSILCSPDLKRELDERAKNRTSTRVMLNSYGRPWTPLGFSASWRKVTKKAGIEDRTFHDLRGTFVMNALRVGKTLEDIARITGHTLKDLRTLEQHYMSFDRDAADAVILAMHGNKK